MSIASQTIDERCGYIRWLFSPPPAPTSSKDVIAWWEHRRLPYNALVGTIAIICFLIYCLSIVSTDILEPGDDVIEPLALMAAPLAVGLINICYTLGWLVDAPLRFLKPSLSSQFTLWLFILGVAFSIFVVSLPAAYWGTYRLLQVIGLLP
jgi:hypothetical protein